MIEVKAPYSAPSGYWTPWVMLLGSIEQDTAIQWQRTVVEALREFEIVIFNPRRDDWDGDLTQRMSNPAFNKQVNWELDAIHDSDLLLMYFDENTKSPVTLLELGMIAARGTAKSEQEVIVACPEKFWRRGNVEIVCHRYNIRLVDSLEQLIEEGRTACKNLC